MITGNKGEWSEIYTLFKLLGDKNLQPGDKNINKLQNVIYPIIKILRSETNGDFEYSVNDDFVFISGGEEVLRIPIVEFNKQATLLFKHLKSNTDRTFSLLEIEEFMSSINCTSLKASSSSKTDITIVIHDQRTNQQSILGFSIKSQLGSPSTLLNAGKTTNFIFKINNSKITDNDIDGINNIKSRSKIIDRIKAITDKGGEFKFLETEKRVFSNNLVLIDSLLPQILAEIVLEFFSTKGSKLSELLSKVEERNPLNFDDSDNHAFYNYKIKRLLTDVALGMMPSKVWTGKYDATGGYLIVKADGDIVCYHIYNRNEFEDYLLNNTKLETASSSRHKFGFLYKENDELFFKLNLQIRFVK